MLYLGYQQYVSNISTGKKIKTEVSKTGKFDSSKY